MADTLMIVALVEEGRLVEVLTDLRSVPSKSPSRQVHVADTDGEKTVWPKRCNCCGASYSRDDWASLPLIGIQRDEYGAPELELRNCACGSTLSIEVAWREMAA
jgi:hypothetical protein